jgi:acetyl-CoA acyltransferase
MRDAVITAAVRTPTGKRNGALSSIHPVDLSAGVLRALVERAGIDPAEIADVIWGCVGQVGEQAFNIARSAALGAGFPETVTGVTVDRQCGSSQQAVHFAAAGVIAGHHDVAIAGGVESMSRIPMGLHTSVGGTPMAAETWRERYGAIEPHQGSSAQMIADRWHLSRTRMDEFALRSHELAATAQGEGRFDAEIIPTAGLSVDEGVRRNSSMEGLAQLAPAFSADGSITAGNSSQISDGASAVLITTSERAAQLGLAPLVRIHTAVLAGNDPILMLTAPIDATAKLLARSGVSLEEIGAFEVNEAFASVPLAWLADTGADEKVLNPNGGAIALGHPLGGSGTRLMTTLVHHMRANGIEYGLQTMCEGGGQANATLLELIGS